MYGLALTAFGLALSLDSARVPDDVQVSPSRRVVLPLWLDPAQRETIKRVRLLVSDNFGASWKYKSDINPQDPRIEFHADRDGQYWFALQTEFKDGLCEPATLAGLVAGVKLYITTKRPVPFRGGHPMTSCSARSRS